jgi:hypothetical protein
MSLRRELVERADGTVCRFTGRLRPSPPDRAEDMLETALILAQKMAGG